eukprot:jgi/Undpi1/5366/HiC_scaffold_2.g00647.m1
MTFSRITAMRRGRYEATEAIGKWTAAYDESGHMFWYDELTHETTYDPSAGRRHPQPHQVMSHTALFARGSTNGAAHMPHVSPPDGDYLMPLSSRAYPYPAPGQNVGGYVTSSGHMVSARPPSYAETSSRFSPLHRQHGNHHQQHYQHPHQQQHYQGQHQHQLGRHAYPGVTLFNGYRWEECFKMDGKKFWRHKETGAIVHKDPYR